VHLPPIVAAALLASVLALPAVVCAATDGYRLEPARTLRQFETYDALAEHRGDLVVFERDGKSWAGYATFVVALPYEERQVLISTVQAATSVASVTPSSRSFDLPRVGAWTSAPDGDAAAMNRKIEEREKLLHEAGLRRAAYRQTEIAFNPMYGSPAEGAHAEVVLSIADAGPVFGGDCSLVTITRVDKTREWARLAHTPIILPFKVAASTRLITSAELESVRSIAARLGRKAAGPVLTRPPLEPLRSFSTLLELKEVVDTTCPRTEGPRR
jgi:hypothetical protein